MYVPTLLRYFCITPSLDHNFTPFGRKIRPSMTTLDSSKSASSTRRSACRRSIARKDPHGEAPSTCNSAIRPHSAKAHVTRNMHVFSNRRTPVPYSMKHAAQHGKKTNILFLMLQKSGVIGLYFILTWAWDVVSCFLSFL